MSNKKRSIPGMRQDGPRPPAQGEANKGVNDKVSILSKVKQTLGVTLKEANSSNEEDAKKAAELLTRVKEQCDTYTEQLLAVDAEIKKLYAEKAKLAADKLALERDIKLLYDNDEAQRIILRKEEIIEQANVEAQDYASVQRRLVEEEIKDKAEQAKLERAKKLEDIEAEVDKLYSEAKAEVEEYLASKESMAKTRAEMIITKAEFKANNIISDAQAQNGLIISSAEEQAKRIVAIAERSKEVIESGAKKFAQKLIDDKAKKDKEVCQLMAQYRQKVQMYEEKMIDLQSVVTAKVDELLAAEKEKLESLKAELKKQEKDLALQRDDIEFDFEDLQNQKDNLKTLIKKKVDEEYLSLQLENQSLKETLNDLASSNKRLLQSDNANKDPELQFADKKKLKETIKALQEELKPFAEYNISKENIAALVESQRNFEQASENNKNLRLELDRLKADYTAMMDSTDMLAEMKRQNSQLQERVDYLSEELNKTKVVNRDSMILPIQTLPESMGGTAAKTLPLVSEQDEIEWLNNIIDKSLEGGIRFTKRQLVAYHTSLKTGDWSPLVVLAGVSGTGKSEMPKQYAIHGGFNFVSIPVKPDWDSPASLFGYYNSIENKFEATELVRALYQVQNGNDYGDEMLLILLDELNLAHPEQYFADLLSKFEGARGDQETAKYEIVLGNGEPPEPLKIGKNVLWTGTMNEDETTKGLSDKVVDRSTIITFPRPKVLFDRSNVSNVPQQFRLSNSVWEKWKLATNDIEVEYSLVTDPTAEEFYDSVIRVRMMEYKDAVTKINDNMDKMGRFLGHRVWQGIQNYIFNYPFVIKYANEGNNEYLEQALQCAFCDALAFKVMPKLRGLETKGANEEYLLNIQKIINEKAYDLKDDFASALNVTTELFHWHSAEFMKDYPFMENE